MAARPPRPRGRDARDGDGRRAARRLGRRSRIKAGWTTSCPFADGSPTVPLIASKTAAYHWVIVGNERLRFYVLDLPAGGTVIVDLDAYDGTEYDALVKSAAPIVRSMQFAAS